MIIFAPLKLNKRLIMKLNCIVVWTMALVFLAVGVNGQVLSKEKVSYTRADSLRGSLNANRSWFDVTYYNLDIEVIPLSKRIAGFNDIYFKVLKPSNKMQLDLFENLEIEKILIQEQECKYVRDGNTFLIDLPNPLKIGATYSLRVYYSGIPIEAKKAPWDGGFVWSKDAKGNDWIGVACEGLGASAWWPNKDHLSDEPDSMHVSCTVPNPLQFIGNGKLVNETKVGEERTKYTWKISYPINNYNVTLNIGDYAHFHETVENGGQVLDLDYYVMKENFDLARKQFQQVKPMLKAYEQYLGPYPFPKDGFALVETPYLGMEHQGAIAYGNKYKPGYSGNRHFINGLDFDYIIIHESGHEWWGNHVGCSDIADLWIHEGFCTYTEAIYVEAMYDKKTAIDYINNSKKSVDNKHKILGDYGVNMEGDGDMYAKGSLMLNTLRSVINNDELWWSIIKGMQERFAMQTITSKDVFNYFNERTGKDLSPIFEQYLAYPEIPVFEYKLIKGKKKKYSMEYRWKAKSKNFNMPFEYSIGDDKNVRINPSLEWQNLQLGKVDISNFKVADHLFYVDVVKL